MRWLVPLPRVSGTCVGLSALRPFLLEAIDQLMTRCLDDYVQLHRMSYGCLFQRGCGGVSVSLAVKRVSGSVVGAAGVRVFRVMRGTAFLWRVKFIGMVTWPLR